MFIKKTFLLFGVLFWALEPFTVPNLTAPPAQVAAACAMKCCVGKTCCCKHASNATQKPGVNCITCPTNDRDGVSQPSLAKWFAPAPPRITPSFTSRNLTFASILHSNPPLALFSPPPESENQA